MSKKFQQFYSTAEQREGALPEGQVSGGARPGWGVDRNSAEDHQTLSGQQNLKGRFDKVSLSHFFNKAKFPSAVGAGFCDHFGAEKTDNINQMITFLNYLFCWVRPFLANGICYNCLTLIILFDW
jgi:hypothetical protein